MKWTWSKKFVVAVVCAVLAFIAFVLSPRDIASLGAFLAFLGAVVKLYGDANVKVHEINGAPK